MSRLCFLSRLYNRQVWSPGIPPLPPPNSNSRVLVYYIEGYFFFFVSIIGCHNCSYSAILNIFLHLQIQLYNTFSLSLLYVHWILCYRIKNISFMVFVKQLKPRIFVQCNCCYTEWSLAFEGEGCGFNPPPWDWDFFSSSTSFLAILTLRVYPGVCASVGRVLRVYLAGLLTTDFDHKHSSGYTLGLW